MYKVLTLFLEIRVSYYTNIYNLFSKNLQFQFKLYSVIVVAMPCDLVLHCPKRYTTAIFTQTPAHFPSYTKLYQKILLRHVFIIWQTSKFACATYILMRANLPLRRYRCQERAVFCVAVKSEHTQRNTLLFLNIVFLS